MSNTKYSLYTVLQNLLFPPRCLFCGALTQWEQSLCDACRIKISAALLHVEENCFGCEEIVWCADYADVYRTGMERFKFNGLRRGQELFGAILLKALRESGILSRTEGIAYVPMPRARERLRGYNQAKLLAEYIAQETGIPLRDGLLRREGKETAHGTENRGERVALVQESYFEGENLPRAGERLLLIDDIITTGTTLATCAALLQKSGAGVIYGAAPLRTPSPEANGKRGHADIFCE